jgi:D-xylose 1-dehydrogenase (NADP+, D-xylono-1,5-lactone-forming)
VLATLDCGFDLPERYGLRVVGSEATLEVDDPWFGVQPGIRVRAADGSVEEMEAPAVDPYRAQLDDLAGAVSGGHAPRIGRAEAVGQARTLQALRRAMNHDEEDVR